MISTVFLIAALFALAVPGSSVFVSELYILIGAFRQQPLLGAAAALGIVLAAMYMLRWYSAIAHEGDGERGRPTTRPTCASSELAIAVPLILILLVMSVWPFGVMERIGCRSRSTPQPSTTRSPSRSSAIAPEIVLLSCACVLLDLRDLPARRGWPGRLAAAVAVARLRRRDGGADRAVSRRAPHGRSTTRCGSTRSATARGC